VVEVVVVVVVVVVALVELGERATRAKTALVHYQESRCLSCLAHMLREAGQVLAWTWPGKARES